MAANGISHRQQSVSTKARNGEIRVEDINEQLITEHLTIADLPGGSSYPHQW